MNNRPEKKHNPSGPSAHSAHPHFDLCRGVVVDVMVGKFSVTGVTSIILLL